MYNLDQGHEHNMTWLVTSGWKIKRIREGVTREESTMSNSTIGQNFQFANEDLFEQNKTIFIIL
jgi:hypothetical protein